MSRKVQEGKLLSYFTKTLNMFESEKYALVEEFINRCNLLFSYLYRYCTDRINYHGQSCNNSYFDKE